MKILVQKFKKHVIKLAANPKFVHHKWYVQYHLNFVESISTELCQKYKSADKELVLLLVWLHDYGKIARETDNKSLVLAKKALQHTGFTNEITQKACEYVERIDSKFELKKAPIEVQIVSSADAAAHLVGPFYSLYWYENPQKNITDLIEGDLRKAEKDWKTKIVLPEIKRAFQKRNDFLQEQRGIFPKKFLK